MRSEAGRARERLHALVQPAGWAVAARWFTALVGGYLATATIATLLARLLPVARVEATVWAMIAACPLFTAILLWSFGERRLVRVAALVWGIAVAARVAGRALGVRP